MHNKKGKRERHYIVERVLWIKCERNMDMHIMTFFIIFFSTACCFDSGVCLIESHLFESLLTFAHSIELNRCARSLAYSFTHSFRPCPVSFLRCALLSLSLTLFLYVCLLCSAELIGMSIKFQKQITFSTFYLSSVCFRL